ncbi:MULTISPECIES: YdbC family protein [unclassified Streptomyces]|uniref:YdbC family protein n=1 Tax=unclassified Streptomyces TaxID=2593676 RepID=UPI00381A8C99
MLVKWIRCGVLDRAAFERGQRKWANGLPGEPGFRGQGGGWSRSQPGVAHLFAFWEDREYYDAFMAGPHDRFATPQADTYESLGVKLFEHRLDVKIGFRPRFADSDLLRLAHCKVRPDRADHFVLMQQKVWNPAMAGSPGMLRGVFAQGPESDFLTLSMWDSAAERGKYRDGSVARLSQRAELEADVLAVAGDVVDLEQSWSV